MTNLILALAAALMTSNAPVAVSNVVAQQTGIAVDVSATQDPVEKEFRKILEDDDAAQEEADRWIKENAAFQAQGAGLKSTTIAARVQERLKPVEEAYEDFLRRHPKHIRARLAYGSFLSDIGREEEGVEHWERARKEDPQNPAAWNNLANYYGHRGPVKKAFEYYAKSIELSPDQSVYYQNLATTVFLFRKDAMEFYQIEEQQVFDKALGLYNQALKLEPTNFLLAQDVAQTYYGIRPSRPNEALQAWENALKLAADDVQREGVYLHLARIKMQLGRLDEAQTHLDQVVNAGYQDLKARLVRNLKEKRAGGAVAASATNSPAANSVPR